MNKPTIFQGIDPAMRDEGTSVCRISGGNVYFYRYELDEILYWIYQSEPGIFLSIRWENAALQRNKRFAGHKARNVEAVIGFCKAMDKAMIFLRQIRPDVEIIGVSPKQKGRKMSDAEFWADMKMNGLEVAKPPKIHARTKKHYYNQDDRDAYKLAMQARQEYRLKLKTTARSFGS